MIHWWNLRIGFSWHEIGFYDLPANIDHILNVTNHKKLFYVGHSQGGTIYYVLTSERPEYNDKIQMSATFGPAVFLHMNKNYMATILSDHIDVIEVTLINKISVIIQKEVFRISQKSFT